MVWKDAWEEIPASITRQFDEFDAIFVDSLLLGKVGPRPAHAFEGGPRRHLLVHYLALCDPKRTDAEWQARERAQMASFDGFITTSAYAKRRLEEAGLPPGAVHCIYPGLEPGYVAASPKREASGPCRLLTVSSLLPGKGLQPLIDLLEGMGDLNWRWTLAGDGTLDPSFAAAIRQRIDRSPLGDRMQWRGAVDAADMPACYRAHDVFVLPSEFETLSMATREALACGLPVVAFEVGGIPENMRSGGGFLIPPFDGKAMQAALRRLVEDVSLRAELGRQALENRKAFPTWEETGEKFLKTIANI